MGAIYGKILGERTRIEEDPFTGLISIQSVVYVLSIANIYSYSIAFFIGITPDICG